ncbi:hypothetical protein [Nocardioides sp.]|uniref:hypothetical protein n=1 Tax=Nocardioides sp. TaxID=35761 RepID=UPI00351515E8
MSAPGRAAFPLIVVVASLALVAGLAFVTLRQVAPGLFASETCTATADGRSVTLDLEQAENAGVIAAIAVARGLPARAVSIALATAYQESDLRNIDYGDRDSLGLFQQRPSQGWGTPAQVQDPVYAANAFYDALERVPGYADLEITVAAQEVQRSAFPGAYADHEDDARVLASALTGYSPGAFACSIAGNAAAGSDELTRSGLVPRAQRVLDDLDGVFGDLSLGGFEPGGVSTGHMAGSAHYDGRAIDVFFRPITEANQRRGWAVAQYLVSQADRLDVRTVIFDDRIWVAGKDDSWRDYDAPSRAGDRAVLEHRDHVHVDVVD